MSSCFGRYFRLSLFGQSHGPRVGVTLERASPRGWRST